MKQFINHEETAREESKEGCKFKFKISDWKSFGGRGNVGPVTACPSLPKVLIFDASDDPYVYES